MAVNPIAANDVVQVTIESEVNQQKCLNVLHYRAKTNLSTVTYFDALDSLMSFVGSANQPSIVQSMLLAMSNTAKILGVRAQRIYPVRSIYARISINEVGAIATPVQSANIGGTITKQTDVAGRGRTGSFHLAGIPFADYTNGSLTVAAVGRLDDIAERIESKMVNAQGVVLWEPGTFSRAPGAGVVFHELTNVFPQTTARVMRRRTVGVGQ